MDRRTLIGSGLAGATLLALGAHAQPAPTLTRREALDIGRLRDIGIRRDLLARLCRTRKDWRNLTAAEVTAFKAGVTAMRAKPASDPTSWTYQAAMHGSVTTPAQPLWNSCQHGTLHFLSWHRLYLHYFERILRAASGSSALTLPYWNWAYSRVLPAAFRDPTAGNPLFNSNRNASINAGTAMPASSVTISDDMAQTGFSGFSFGLEGTPHGSVHVSIGGWMGQVSRAAGDPIFWLHHCQIDRMWEEWLKQGGGRINPTDAAWLDREFDFFDENGQRVTRKARDGLALCGTMGYVYADPFRFPLVRLPIARPVLDGRVRPRPPTESAAAPIPLGARPARATVPVEHSATEAAGERRTLLVFESLTVTNPDGYYEIYLSPRQGSKLEPDNPAYAGNLVLFGVPIEGQPDPHAGHQMEGAADPRSRVYDISGWLREQRRRGRRVDPDRIEVVLRLRTPEGDSALEAAEAPRASVGSIRIVEE
jgi:tyrosinase